MASGVLSYLPFVGGSYTTTDVKTISLPSVEIHQVETDRSRRARTLKHLLKANHVNHSVVYHNLRFDNHLPHHLSSAYLLGANEAKLLEIYEKKDEQLESWKPSPAEVVEDDWREFLGDKLYQRAYVDFFEDQLAMSFAYDWKKLVARFLFTGNEPLIHGLIGGLGHPLIHLGYAFEMDSREVATEGLALAAVQWNYFHKYLDQPVSTETPPFTSTSPRVLIDKLSDDQRFDGLFSEPGFGNVELLFEKHEALLLEYWNGWVVEDPVTQFRQSQELAVDLFVATVSSESHAYSFLIVHLLTTSHAVRILLPFIPAQFHMSLVREWWLLTLAVYIAELRPKIDPGNLESDIKERDWQNVADQSLASDWSNDAHFLKAIRAMREAANTWGDEDERYIDSAITFIQRFQGW